MEQVITEYQHERKQTDCNQPGEGTRNLFSDLSTKELSNLRYYSTNIAVLGFLWGITFFTLLVQLTIVPSELIAPEVASLPGGVYGRVIVLILLFAGTIGCFVRRSWARYCGIVVSAIMLPLHYLLTLFGIFGLVSFIKGNRLFGPDGLNRNELIQELKYRNKRGID